MRSTASAAFAASLVAVAVLVAARTLWQLRVLLALLFLAFILAAALRPGVEALRRRRVPRGAGLALHFLVLAGAAATAIWLVVPPALHQARTALGDSPGTAVARAARHSGGIKGTILTGLEKALRSLPAPHELLHPALSATMQALAIFLGVAFVLACAAYWVLDRDRILGFVLALVPHARRRTVRDTWDLVERRLGAYVRAQLTMIAIVSVALSTAFWAIGLPYWILLGTFAGIVEIVPIVGPLAAAVVSIGVGLTVSTKAAVLAAVAVYGLRILQDYLIGPRIVGHAVALAPLLVLVNVSAMGVLLGPALVPLATPLAEVLATLVDVILAGKDPAEMEVPRVLLPAKE